MKLLSNPQLHSMLDHLSETVELKAWATTTLTIAILAFAFGVTSAVPYIDILLGLAALQVGIITLLIAWWQFYGKAVYGMQAMFDQIKMEEGRQ
jgi:hypothetical protein